LAYTQQPRRCFIFPKTRGVTRNHVQQGSVWSEAHHAIPIWVGGHSFYLPGWKAGVGFLPSSTSTSTTPRTISAARRAHHARLSLWSIDHLIPRQPDPSPRRSARLYTYTLRPGFVPRSRFQITFRHHSLSLLLSLRQGCCIDCQGVLVPVPGKSRLDMY
jgi:hypothetical protein